jgi:hypothetical protein
MVAEVMTQNASLKLDEKEYSLSVLVCAEWAKAIDIRELRASSPGKNEQ